MGVEERRIFFDAHFVFMLFEANIPKMSNAAKVPCVYRITLNTGYFYIGSTVNLKKRIWDWQSIHRSTKRTDGVNAEFLEKIRLAVSSILTIEELCSHDEVRDRETVHLDLHKENPLMMSKPDKAWRAVLQYSMTGNFIKRHVSIAAAARFVGTKPSSVEGVLAGAFRHAKSYYFKYEDETIKRVHSRDKNRKDVVVMNELGSEIDRLRRIMDVSEKYGVSVDSIWRVMTGKQKSTRGYVFKYS